MSCGREQLVNSSRRDQGLPLRNHLTRHQMYQSIGQFLCTIPTTGKVLAISSANEIFAYFDQDLSELIETSYPDVDIQSLPFADEMFDFVISDQVLEHVTNPFVAVEETRRVLRTGGVAIHTTCFMNYVHQFPIDYWRFSPEALRYLCRNFARIEQADGWGNRLAQVLMFASDRFRYMSIPKQGWSWKRWVATWNEAKYPVVTWVIARK